MKSILFMLFIGLGFSHSNHHKAKKGIPRWFDNPSQIKGYHSCTSTDTDLAAALADCLGDISNSIISNIESEIIGEDGSNLKLSNINQSSSIKIGHIDVSSSSIRVTEENNTGIVTDQFQKATQLNYNNSIVIKYYLEENNDNLNQNLEITGSAAASQLVGYLRSIGAKVKSETTKVGDGPVVRYFLQISIPEEQITFD